MSTWNIHEATGRYVGQHKSASAALAFCEYMSLYEPRPPEDEISVSPAGDGTLRLEYDSREFLLSEAN